MAEEEQVKEQEKGKEIDPGLKEFIDWVIVPALVREWLGEEQSRQPSAQPAEPPNTKSSKEPA